MSTPVTPRRPVLVMNGDRDAVEMVTTALELAGLRVVTAEIDRLLRDEDDLRAIVAEHRPAVVVFDVGLPYDTHWRYLESLRKGVLERIPIVVTTTNERALRTMVGTSDEVIELLGKPYDLGRLVAAVQSVYVSGPGA